MATKAGRKIINARREWYHAARHLSHDGGSDPVKMYDERPSVLTADDVARAVVFSLDQPPHVTMAQITVLPSHQG